MLNSLENKKPIVSKHPDIFSHVKLPAWENEMLHGQGFTELDLKRLQRKGVEKNEYLIFSNKNEFKKIEAETVTIAMEKSEISKPYKITNAYCRMSDIIELEKLEFIVKKEEGGVQAETTAENADTTKAETTGKTPQTAPDAPATEEPKPEETSS